jgi:hypothetical protein
MSAPDMHPDDVFHVMLDALAIIAKMTPEDMARLNAGRPPWGWYDMDLSAGADPKTNEVGWRAVATEAEIFALMVLDNGLSGEMLGGAAKRSLGLEVRD